MGTLATKSQAVAKRFSTRSWSSAKNRILRIRRRTASADDNSSTRFSGPCSRKNRAETGAVQFSPDLASSPAKGVPRSEEHTSELQSHLNLVCRLLLEK